VGGGREEGDKGFKPLILITPTLTLPHQGGGRICSGVGPPPSRGREFIGFALKKRIIER